MNDREILGVVARVLATIAPEADLSRVSPTDDLRRTLDIDSFDYLRLLQGLHRELGIDIPQADYRKLGTLQAMLQYLQAATPSFRVGP